MEPEGPRLDPFGPHQDTFSIDVCSDPELRRLLERGAPTGDLTTTIREAFVLMERRIQESAGLEEHLHGKELIDKAFHPDNGILQPISPVGAERAGLHYFLLGIFLYYRNPIAHRPIYHEPESALRILSLIDHALGLVSESVERSLDLSAHVGPHEGQIQRRRDYRLDIDGDGQDELVILLELGKVKDGDELAPHLLPIILKKDDRGLRRIPTEGIKGQSIYGPYGVNLRYVSSKSDADIEVKWTWGETQGIVLLLRRKNDRYVLAERELLPGISYPYSAPVQNAFLIHFRQLVTIADVDGDGFDELIESLLFDPDDLEAMGYPSYSDNSQESLRVCRVWKWDDTKGLIVQTEEKPIVESSVPPSHFPGQGKSGSVGMV